MTEPSMELPEALKQCLPPGCELELCHLSSKGAYRGKKNIIHTLVAVQGGLIIYAAEVMILPGTPRTTLYVSKVDTTGCHNRSGPLISRLTYGFLLYLLSQQIGSVRICLFARSQPQYIFPCSSQNPGKHLLDDRALVKWWISVFEKLQNAMEQQSQTRAFLLIPGFEASQLRHYLPKRPDWSIGHPFMTRALAIDQIPQLPDDPKGRFLDQLESDKLSSTTTVESFWEQMAYRQEMSSGHEIGFFTLDMTFDDVRKIVPMSMPMPEKDYKLMYNALIEGVYESHERTANATREWLSLLTSIKSVRVFIVVGCSEASSKQMMPTSKRRDQAATTVSGQSDSSINVLVPRKKAKKA